MLWHWHYSSKKSSSVSCFYDQNSVHIVSETLFTYLNNSVVICFFGSEKLKNTISACYFSLFSDCKKQTNNDLFKNMTRILMSKQLTLTNILSIMFYTMCWIPFKRNKSYHWQFLITFEPLYLVRISNFCLLVTFPWKTITTSSITMSLLRKNLPTHLYLLKNDTLQPNLC